ncbi:helix-turn-helix transcriptional regulator [Ciceribacter ferrooxidans]|uniref:Helix-turn-helix domain-containing protein n=1 Tax=Ciceribacter ferrooxidans TaxID=2509717 RepID=A0A4Q2TW77_9HYPH|nr:AraC family transcriptional regulator [Ciceribacter ferrooxidans]RYC25796.1 helix-turn-helix domain-containing protein [Ciceribacter ferrooxidans]
MTDRHAIHHRLRCSSLAPALARRSMRLTAPPYGHFVHLLVLSTGQWRLRSPARDDLVIGPAVAILPPCEDLSLIVDPGSAGHLFGLAGALLAELVEDQPEGHGLKLLLSQEIVRQDVGRTEIEALVPLLRGLSEELEREHPSVMASSAFLQLLLLRIWRLTGADDLPFARPAKTGDILQRFRHLVESHFEEQRPIGFYAEQLGITADRLHSLCSRALGRTPIELVHERTIREAKIKLERSSRTIHGIAESLGFHDPTYFSHFFKRKTGLSPAAYRQSIVARGNRTGQEEPASYADWP